MLSHKKTTERGFALLISIVVASILLALGLSMLSATSKQLTLSSTTRDSEIAFQAAVGGLECIMYHRRQNSAAYFTEVIVPPTPPAINCFNVAGAYSQSQQKYALDSSSGDNYTNHFEYQFSWGDDGLGNPNRCSEMILFVMVADTVGDGGDHGPVDFSSYNDAIGGGGDGNKTCLAGNRCSIVVARGYNASCDDVANGLATVQREITSQF